MRKLFKILGDSKWMTSKIDCKNNLASTHYKINIDEFENIQIILDFSVLVTVYQLILL